ncbi:DUF6302 family protein [Streptomyces sp. NPDC091279]|uniref:DUF6302 family protein n=1 Tax=unclassified Streptomyces TaxID=2593676 RepID=UPI00380DA50D
MRSLAYAEKGRQVLPNFTCACSTASHERFQPRLLPPQAACDYDYFRERLDDPLQADSGVAVALFGRPLLAVPVGGKRRGGYASYESLTDALQARDLHATVPVGFPDLRVRWSPDADTCHPVRWGDPAPRYWEGGDDAEGRHHGYSDDAIAAFLRGCSRPRRSAAD